MMSNLSYFDPTFHRLMFWCFCSFPLLDKTTSDKNQIESSFKWNNVMIIISTVVSKEMIDNQSWMKLKFHFQTVEYIKHVLLLQFKEMKEYAYMYVVGWLKIIYNFLSAISIRNYHICQQFHLEDDILSQMKHPYDNISPKMMQSENHSQHFIKKNS